ncbi:hypothetical protein ACSHT0_04175 [Tepidicaulis sp. LMO-SS28]|uniref:hypothetical protein n=1 Tax=Tepidicaulis sp. LMO-SS28 TaxID=3447455 RepID=UPI003EE33C84
MRQWKGALWAGTLALAFMACAPANAGGKLPTLDGTWTVEGYSFFPISAMDAEAADAYLGKEQYFEKGFAEGPFFACEFQGLSAGYDVRDVAEFMSDPENRIYAEAGLSGGRLFEHEIACEGTGAELRMITDEASKHAFIALDGVVFRLHYQE